MAPAYIIVDMLISDEEIAARRTEMKIEIEVTALRQG